jgi:hypothetical protein
MKKVWEVLNSRLISMVIANSALVLFLYILFRILVPDTAPIEDDSVKLDTLAHLQMLEFREVPAEASDLQRFVGRFRNNSSYIIQRVIVAACRYNSANQLIDVRERKLEGVGVVAPGAEAPFEFPGWRKDEPGISQETKENTARVELKFIDVWATRR